MKQHSPSDGKVTPGPWQLGPGYMEGLNGAGGFIPNSQEDRELIVAAVNACFQVSKENPKAVAEAIPEMIEFLKELADEKGEYGAWKAQRILSRLGIEERKA